MSWQDQLKPASFRGVAFYVDTASMEFGRRNQIHEYPGRDVPYGEDLGQMADNFSIDAYILGDDYIAQKEKLMSAIRDNKTAGTLILPTFKPAQVMPIQPCTVRFTSRDGGIEYFTLSFKQAGKNQNPTEATDSGSSVISKAITARAVIDESFIEQYTPPVFAYAKTDAINTTNQFSTTLNQFLGRVTPTNNGAFTIGSALTFLTSTASTLIQNPSSWTSAVSNVFTSISGAFDDVSSANSIFTSMSGLLTFGTGLPALFSTTPNRKTEAKNRNAMTQYIRRNAVVMRAESTKSMTFASYNDAVLIRDQVADDIDDLIVEVGATDDDKAVNALDDLRAAVVKDITDRSATLKRIKKIELNDSLPVLSLCYELFGSLENETDIINRNRIIRPTHVPAGQLIEVLT